MQMTRLRKALKKFPGAYWVVRKVRKIVDPPGTGAWLYNQSILTWLYEPALKVQLPFLYRFFATYCWLQYRIGRGRVAGAGYVFRLVVWITQLFKCVDSVQLHLGIYSVFLDLSDPRMLYVPTELLNARSGVALLSTFLTKGDTFVDVGANHGSFSIMAAKLVGDSGLIIAIEPQVRLAHLLEKTLAHNSLGQYEVQAIACGEQDGQIEFYVPRGSSGEAGIFQTFSATSVHEKYIVPLKRFDDAFDWKSFPGRLFVKLDVEGSELAFLQGARMMISSRKPHIMMEINPFSMKASGVTGEIIGQYLMELGYKRFVEIETPTVKRALEELALPYKRNRNVVVVPTVHDELD